MTKNRSWGLVLAAIWAPVLWRMSVSWRVDEEMIHGWAVPLLVLYLAFDRGSEAGLSFGARGRGSTLGLVLSLSGLALGLLIWEANPLWPRIMWLSTGMAVLASVTLIARSGGWKLARFWTGYLLLLFIALPWPTMLQLPITIGLSAVNAQVAAEVVSAMGHPGAVHGQIIEVAEGVVGVEEACSGIRSLQTVTMAGVFLASLFRIGWPRGVVLVMAGWGLAMVGNLVRTCYLVHVLAAEGYAAMEAVHDSAGSVVLIVTLSILGVLAWRIPRPAFSPSALLRSENAPRSFGGNTARVSVGLLIAMLTVEVAIRLWYSPVTSPRQRVDWEWGIRPEGRDVVVPKYARRLLDYSEGGGWTWIDEQEGVRGLAYRFFWKGDAQIKGQALKHDPTICLPHAGSVLERELTPLLIDASGARIPLRSYRFATPRGQTQYVFFQVWDAFAAREVSPETARSVHFSARWDRVVERRRGTDLYQLFLVLEGPTQDAEALRYAEAWFPQIFRSSSGLEEISFRR